VYEEVIPPGSYWTRVLDRRQRLRITDVNGAQGCSLLAYNVDLLSERYNAPDTVKVQNQIFLTTGRVLLSDLGRVLLSIVDDTNGHHETLAGFSDAASVSDQFGDGSYLDLRNDRYRNARDNFVMALGRHGLERRDLTMSFNPFARVLVADDGALEWVAGLDAAGASIELRAEMRVLVAISATHHVLDPAAMYAPGPLRVQVLDAIAPTADDLCRRFGPEAQRAFENTDDYWQQVVPA
jgi:urea carboxylase-associated protein 2